jgi:hypothetical protein
MKGIYQVRFRKVASIRKIAKSATDSVEAAALRRVRSGTINWKGWKRRITYCSRLCLMWGVNSIFNSGVLRTNENAYLAQPKALREPNQTLLQQMQKSCMMQEAKV